MNFLNNVNVPTLTHPAGGFYFREIASVCLLLTFWWCSLGARWEEELHQTQDLWGIIEMYTWAKREFYVFGASTWAPTLSVCFEIFTQECWNLCLRCCLDVFVIFFISCGFALCKQEAFRLCTELTGQQRCCHFKRISKWCEWNYLLYTKLWMQGQQIEKHF